MRGVHAGGGHAHVDVAMPLHTDVVEHIIVEGIKPSLVGVLVGVDRNAADDLRIHQDVRDAEDGGVLLVAMDDAVPRNLAIELLDQRVHFRKGDRGQEDSRLIVLGVLPLECPAVLQLAVEHLHGLDLRDELLLDIFQQLISELNRSTHDSLPPVPFLFSP